MAVDDVLGSHCGDRSCQLAVEHFRDEDLCVGRLLANDRRDRRAMTKPVDEVGMEIAGRVDANTAVTGTATGSVNIDQGSTVEAGTNVVLTAGVASSAPDSSHDMP